MRGKGPNLCYYSQKILPSAVALKSHSYFTSPNIRKIFILFILVVCKVENTSGFNTSLVTSVQINQDEIRPPFQIPPQPKEEKPPAKEEDDEKLEDEHIIPVKPQSPPKGRRGRSVPEGKTVEKLGAKEPLWTWRRSLFPEKIPADSSGSGPEAIYEEDSSGDSSEEEGRDNVIAWNLLGIFQLSDHVACDPGSSGSLNICGLECSGEWRTNTPWYIQAIFLCLHAFILSWKLSLMMTSLMTSLAWRFWREAATRCKFTYAFASVQMHIRSLADSSQISYFQQWLESQEKVPR